MKKEIWITVIVVIVFTAIVLGYNYAVYGNLFAPQGPGGSGEGSGGDDGGGDGNGDKPQGCPCSAAPCDLDCDGDVDQGSSCINGLCKPAVTLCPEGQKKCSSSLLLKLTTGRRNNWTR